jgi:hypothetical protein
VSTTVTQERTCARCHSPVEPEDLRCAICSLATPALTRTALQKARATVVRC